MLTEGGQFIDERYLGGDERSRGLPHQFGGFMIDDNYQHSSHYQGMKDMFERQHCLMRQGAQHNPVRPIEILDSTTVGENIGCETSVALRLACSRRFSTVAAVPTPDGVTITRMGGLGAKAAMRTATSARFSELSSARKITCALRANASMSVE